MFACYTRIYPLTHGSQSSVPFYLCTQTVDTRTRTWSPRLPDFLDVCVDTQTRPLLRGRRRIRERGPRRRGNLSRLGRPTRGGLSADTVRGEGCGHGGEVEAGPKSLRRGRRNPERRRGPGEEERKLRQSCTHYPGEEVSPLF